jgi:uncharacterized protein YjdB
MRLLPPLAAAIMFFAACSKKSADTPVATVPERLEITPVTKSIDIGETAAFALKFFDVQGKEAAVPANISWSSTNTAIATVTQTGTATGVSSGQVEIKATYKNVTATALLTVVLNNTQVATVTIETALKEIKLNDMATLTATARNNLGQLIPGVNFTWQSDNTALVEVNPSSGLVTGKAYGTANLVATSNSIQSAPSMVQVIRIGAFTGQGSAGSAKLKIENGILKLQTSSDFISAGGAPDLRIYLGDATNNITNAVEIATLTQRTGMQTWNVPAGITITQYRYVFIWCKQFGGNYGSADLGQ